MSDAIRVRSDLTVGQENNPGRETGSVILKRWMEDRRAAKAAAAAAAVRATKAKRTYAGAAPSRLNAGWSMMPVPPNWHIWQGLQALRARSREQFRNNDYARKFVGMCKTNISGPTGIMVQMRAKDPDGSLDSVANAAIEEAWKDWCMDEADAAGRLTFAQIEQMADGTTAIDGEILVQIVRKGPYAFRLKLIDPELLDIRYNEQLPGGVKVRMGVESDADGRTIAFHFLEGSDDLFEASYYTGKRIRIPATDILHLFLPEHIDQARGVPWMASAITRMKNLHGYEEAAVVAARVGASKMGFYKESATSMEEPAGGVATAQDEDTGEFLDDAEPGTFGVIPKGYEFQSFNPDYPHQQFGEFVKSCLRGMSAGLGVAYTGLSNDLEGVNFSSIRSGVLEEREAWKILQAWHIHGFTRPIFMAWLSTQLMLGTIKVQLNPMMPPKPLPASKFEKFRRGVVFQGRRWAWVDPARDMAANETAIALGLKSRSEIIREQGRDPEQVWKEIAKEQEEMRAAGIDPAAAFTQASQDASKRFLATEENETGAVPGGQEDEHADS